MAVAAHDPAFREHASGLYVPASVSREREVWPRDEWRIVDKAVKILKAHGIQFAFRCGTETCGDPVLKVVREAASGGRVWRCGHKDRPFHRL